MDSDDYVTDVPLARASCNDHVDSDDYVPDVPLARDSCNDHMDSDDYVPDVPLARASCDKTCNSFGLKLLHLCKSTCFRIVKGRLGHEFGNGVFTFASQQGASVIDYVLARECDFANINMFSVQDFSGFSDHCPISFSLNCYVQLNEKTL